MEQLQSVIASYFVFVYKYGKNVNKKKLSEDLKRKPSFKELDAQFHFLFHHMKKIRQSNVKKNDVQ